MSTPPLADLIPFLRNFADAATNPDPAQNAVSDNINEAARVLQLLVDVESVDRRVIHLRGVIGEHNDACVALCKLRQTDGDSKCHVPYTLTNRCEDCPKRQGLSVATKSLT